MITLYGTRTSPYVRRVRVVAAELNLGVDLVDTSTDEGQEQLREVTPIWRVPTAAMEGEVVFDSHVIIDRLIAKNGWGPLRERSPADVNLETVGDAALDCAINGFYLIRRDGLDPAQAPYLQKQLDRVTSAMEWLAEQLPEQEIGLLEIGLATTLDWMRFREAWPVDDHPRLAAAVDRWLERPSLAGTRPGF